MKLYNAVADLLELLRYIANNIIPSDIDGDS